MILYYALTTYHIQCCVLHKITVNRDKKAILLLSDIHKNSVAFLQRYKGSGIFDDVVILEESAINAAARKSGENHVPVSHVISKACGSLKKILPFKQRDIDEYYLCPDHFPFGWYIIKNKIKYHCFEEGCGVLSDNEFMMSNLKRNMTQYKIVKKLGCLSENDYVSEILADKKAQKKGYENDKMTDFSVKGILMSLDESDLKKVFSFFGVKEKIKSNEKLSLILTQHMANLGIMPLDKQHLIYQLFADYFLNATHIIVKPHPDDIAGRYKDIFTDADVLPFAMPSELLPFIIDKKLSTAIAANSTAVKSLGDFCDRMICFDNRIMSDFEHIHRYFTVIKLIENLNICKTVDVCADELLFSELAQSEKADFTVVVTDKNNLNGKLCVVSDLAFDDEEIINKSITGRLLQTEGTIIFLNENNRCLFFDGENTDVFRKIRPVIIKFTDKNGIAVDEEVIHVYSNDENIIKNAEQFNCEKELKYTGVKVNINSISKNEAEKIKVLEGVLQATEQRLKEYIKAKRLADANN